MRRLPPHLAPLGYSPRRYLPLSSAPVLGMGERLTDLRDLQAMFSNGELGGYWPAAPAYAYEDSAGTTAASVNGVVGLRFDVSKGLALGPNVLANSDFDSDTVWVKGDGWSISNGIATRGVTGTTSLLYQYSVLVPNCFYQIKTVCSVSTPYGLIYSNNNGFSFSSDNPSFLLFADTSTFRAGGNALYSGTYDYITAQLLPGNHALQATTGNKPYLRLTPTTNKPWYDSNTATGAMNVTFSGALGSACTIATVTPEGVTIAENQTVGATYNICPPYGYNSDVLIINRALTPAEKALVKRVMQRSVPVLGSELVVNGGFESDTVWSKGSGWSINGGVAAITVSPLSVISQPISFGQKIYSISYTLTQSVGACYFKLTGGTGMWGVARYAGGNYREIVITKSNVSFQFEAATGFSGTVDNASVREIV